jgi:phosphopantothenoylcysteine decarboxylase/phosphopantothenate--cysteine ligase
VSPGTGTFGGDRNTIHLVDADGVEHWPAMTKREVAARLADRLAASLAALDPR